MDGHLNLHSLFNTHSSLLVISLLIMALIRTDKLDLRFYCIYVGFYGFQDCIPVPVLLYSDETHTYTHISVQDLSIYNNFQIIQAPIIHSFIYKTHKSCVHQFHSLNGTTWVVWNIAGVSYQLFFAIFHIVILNLSALIGS